MRVAAILLLLCLCLTLAAPAQAPAPPAPRTVYAGGGRMLELAPPRQLSLNAAVSGFLYQPGSLEIAYSGTHRTPTAITQFVELTGTRTGTLAVPLSQTHLVGETDAPYTLVGWDAAGRFLLVEHREWTHSPDGTEEDFVPVWDSVDVSTAPFTVRRVPIPPGSVGLSGQMHPAPGGTQFAVGASYAGIGMPRIAYVFDPATSSVQTLTLLPGSVLLGWKDDTHLLLARGTGPTRTFFSRDIHSEQETPATNDPAPAALPPRLYPEVSLSVPTLPVTLIGPDGLSGDDARAVWLRVAGLKQPAPAALLALSTGTDDPRAILAPDQRSAAWVRNGDLFATQFTLRDATTRERYDAGDDLSCTQEREIAEGNLKQIGTALSQYVQDYDDILPPQDRLADALPPYLKSPDALSVRGRSFVYTPPPDLTVSTLNDPAHTVMGTLALPCATVTLYADGHVASVPTVACRP